MSRPNTYRFSIDEQAPKVPTPKEFGSVLAAVNAKKFWYTKPWVWGGTAVITAVATIGGWFYLNYGRTDQLPEAPVATENVIKVEPKTPPPVQDAVTPAPVTPDQSVAHVNPPVRKPAAPWKPANPVANPQKPVVKDTPAPVKTEPVVAAGSNPVPTQVKWFGLPYDTVQVADGAVAGKLKLKNGTEVEYPANTWLTKSGSPAQGSIQFLFRQAADQADMIISGIAFNTRQDGQVVSLNNNGAFEVLVLQGTDSLGIATDKHIIVNYPVQSMEGGFSGYQYNPQTRFWERMDETDRADDVKTAPAKGNKAVDVYQLKRKPGFWNWVRSIFRKPAYEKVTDSAKAEKIEVAQEVPLKTINPGQMRAFEIHSPGWFSSGAPVVANNNSSMSFQVIPDTKDTLQGGVYQVFVDRNQVVYHKDPTHALLTLKADDHCILIAFLANKNQVAVLDLAGFDMDVKTPMFNTKYGMVRGSEHVPLMLNVLPMVVKNMDDFRMVLVQCQTPVGPIKVGSNTP